VRSWRVILLVAFTLVGCGQGDKVRDDLFRAQVKITELETALVKSRGSISNLKDVILRDQTARDSLKMALQAASERVRQLESRLRKARVPSATVAQVGELEERLRSVRAQLRECGKNLDLERARSDSILTALPYQELPSNATPAQLATMDERLEQLIRQRDSVFTALAEVGPWYAYFKNEASRSWFKRLFGVGKAQKPQVPEPLLKPAPPNAPIARES